MYFHVSLNQKLSIRFCLSPVLTSCKPAHPQRAQHRLFKSRIAISPTCSQNGSLVAR
jgi:hypothetical protein